MLPEDIEIQAGLAQRVGRVLEAGPGARRTKADGSLVTEIDERLQAELVQWLQSRWPQYPVLGEEMDPQRQQALLAHPERPFWCLDPLDGTTNFDAQLPFYSVSVALVDRSGPYLGVVYDPERGECFRAQRGSGAFVNDRPLTGSRSSRPLREAVAAVDFKRLSADLATRLVCAPPYRSQRNLGSCALEWAWLAAGRLDVYLHGGMKLWDHAAGQLILAEAGGQACTLAGQPLDALSLAPQSVVAARDAVLYRDWCHWLGIPA